MLWKLIQQRKNGIFKMIWNYQLIYLFIDWYEVPFRHKVAKADMCYFCFDVLYCHLYGLQPPQVTTPQPNLETPGSPNSVSYWKSWIVIFPKPYWISIYIWINFSPQSFTACWTNFRRFKLIQKVILSNLYLYIAGTNIFQQRWIPSLCHLENWERPKTPR